MEGHERYPFSLKLALQQGSLENILDSNMFSAYIPHELSVPPINDARKTQRPPVGVERHPGYVCFNRINQIFSYIGFIKRCENKGYRQYLPQLFHELNLFIRIMEDVIYNLNITIPVEIYQEQKRGVENFFASYQKHMGHQIDWIGKIWKNQKTYLERMDMLIDTLKMRGRVFDYSESPLYETVINFCRSHIDPALPELPNDVDIRFIANSCVKAAQDKAPKILWSGDHHILQLLKTLYSDRALTAEFPQLYLYSNYEPHNHNRWFPSAMSRQ